MAKSPFRSRSAQGNGSGYIEILIKTLAASRRYQIMIGSGWPCSAPRVMLAGLLLSAVLPAYAQSPFQDTGGPAAVPVQGGPSGTRISVRVNRAAAEGDSIHVVTNTSRLQAVLIMPDGRRIVSATAESSGFRWAQFPNQVPLGLKDGGYQIVILFTKPARAGVYSILFTSAATERAALAQTWFTSRMQEFEKFVQSMPDAQIAKPVSLSSGEPAKIEIKTAMTGTAFLDVVVPNASVEVTLTLPSGKIVRPGDAKEVGLGWQVENDLPGPASSLGILGEFALPVKGTHNMIAIPNAAAGTYTIGAIAPAGTTGQLRVALLPFEEAAKSLGKRMMFPTSEGGVAMRLSTPIGAHFVGDQVEVTVELNGAVGVQPPDFVVRTETQPYVASAPAEQGGGRRLGPAGPVATMPVTFHKDNDGTYRCLITLREAGWTRVAVRAKGRKATGEPFAVEEVTNIPTDPIVARVADMQAQAKDENGDGKFESLEVALDVDVIVPGEYMFSAGVSGEKEAGPSKVTKVQLGSGRQRVAAVFPSGKIWNQLRSGPLNVQASLTLVLGFGTFVPVPGRENLSRQLEYRREQWATGAYSSEDRVTVHGIRPAASGRYSIAEVEWEASTPGGQCAWGAQLTDRKSQRPLFDRHYQAVPAGPRKFSFLFDGAGIASAGSQDWTFSADVACGDRKDLAKFPAASLDLNSNDYEASQSALQLGGTVALTQWAPGSRNWQTMLTAKGDAAESAVFEITKLPEGWKGNVYQINKSRDYNAVNVFVETPPGASPGRYFIEVTTTVRVQRVAREFVLDLLESIQ